MPQKRGRPVLSLSNDPAFLRRRKRTAIRNREYYARRRAAQAITNSQPTPEQLSLGERIADLSLTKEENAAVTLQSLGLRVTGGTYPQDTVDARMQEQATTIDEHSRLYQEDKVARLSQSRLETHQPINIGQRDTLTDFFQSRPPVNPFASTHAGPSTEGSEVIARNNSCANHLTNLTPEEQAWIQGDTESNQGLTAEEQQWIRRELQSIQPEQDNETQVFGYTEADADNNSVISAAADDYTPGDCEHDTDQIIQADDQDDANSSESTVYEFASEHSGHGEETLEGEEEESALEYTAKRLFEQLQDGHHGCTAEQHEQYRLQHNADQGANHYRLDDVFNDNSFPSVLGLAEMITPERLARQPMPTPAQWQFMFCGVSPQRDGQRRIPMNICLHAEETQAVEPDVSSDIDSFLGFASSLVMARQGLWYQPAPKAIQNITKDNHVETTIYRDGDDPERPARAGSAMLRDVPHFLLGRVVGAHDITLHILFPHLTVTADRFTSMTKEQLTRWLDRIFLPAMHRHFPAHYTQHMPASLEHAWLNSRAAQVEGRQIETVSYQSQQSLGYHLQEDYLDLLWTDILDTINTTPGLRDFREPQIFFSAKNTKLQFKSGRSRPTLLDVMENFEAYFERIIDLDFIYRNRFWVDVGKEICPRVSLVSHQQNQFGDEAQVYSWKRCCLEEYMRWMYEGRAPAVKGRGQRYYYQNMLYEACSLTSVAPKKSRLREGGLVYSQFYGSVKEVWDVAKQMPFANDGLEEIALDPQIREGARHAAGGRRRNATVIENAYCHSKRRAHLALKGSVGKSFGIREEHRISWQLYQALMDELRTIEREDLEVIIADCPQYAWAVKTRTYLNFLWRSADKFATGFEVVRAGCDSRLITWEQTKMMAMFLRGLRFVLGGNQLEAESALWWSRRERVAGNPPVQRLWYGLGFCNTLPRYKYCWLEPRFDWNRLQFKSAVTDNVLFGNSTLRGQYLRRGRQTQYFFDTNRRLELALEWMDQHHANRTIRDQLILFIITICLQQFRIDVLGSIKPEIIEAEREEVLEGHKPFCYEYFEEIMTNRVYLMSGNRCEFKRVSDLGHFLFDYDDGRIRSHWEDKPFRKLYRRARTALTIRYSALGLGRIFSRRLWRHLYAYHWVLPYPCAEVMLQTTKEGKRMWYSIDVLGEVSEPYTSLEPEKWEWARKSWKVGQPEVLPTCILWDRESGQEWILRNSGT